MRRSKTIPLSEAIGDYIRELNIGSKLNEVSVVNSWEEIVGRAVSSRTTKVYIRDRVLYVHLSSSVVRNELVMLRQALKEKINGKIGEEVITDIVFR